MRPKPTSGRIDIRPSGFFGLRTPLLPFDVLRSWAAGIPGATAEDDARRLTARLCDLVREPAIREALFVASPSLNDALNAWLVDPYAPRSRGVTPIVVRYIMRMTSRSTPFGLFAGCTTGTIAERTALRLAPATEYRRYTRLDTHYLCALATALEGDDSIWKELCYRPNSSIFAIGGQLRYVEQRIAPDTRERTFHLVAAEASDYLLATLQRAQNGATAHALAAALENDEISNEAALAYVRELAQTQLLESELTPAVTGREPLDGVIAALGSNRFAPKLGHVRGMLREIDRSPPGMAIARYAAVAERLGEFPAKVEPARLFQVDLYKPAIEAMLGQSVVREMQAAIAMLRRISTPSESPELAKFREAFSERYELAEVPLALALDEELGVGFSGHGGTGRDPSPLLNGLLLPDPPPAASRGVADSRGRDELIVRRVSELARTDEREWVLGDTELKELEAKHEQPIPDAVAVFATIAARDESAVDRGEFVLHVHGVTGPSGANLLGRFCLGDPELRARVEAHLREEERARPDAVFAEIVHLPEGRTGNILGRPVLRSYEIPYLGRSGAAVDCQIPIEDLLVAVRGEAIVLRSKRLGCEVLPRLTTAHNYEAAELGIYRFLCALQGRSSLGWRWPTAAGLLPFLPRVRVGRAVLSLARWLLAASELKALDVPSRVNRMNAVRLLRERRRLPRWVSVADADNVLPVDLENVLCIDSLIALVKTRTQLDLTELFPSLEDAIVEGPEGRFAHEVVVPFVCAREQDAKRPAPAPTSARRTFPPGSEWLYAKIYAGPATADRVLRDVIAPLREEAIRAGDADSWFFLRYADPQHHLRVRFHGEPARLLGRVLPALHDALAPWLVDGRVVSLQLDTYNREVERYGGDVGIALAERWFRADSDAVADICGMLVGDTGEDLRWRLALYGMHAILIDLGFSLAERLELVAQRRRAFAREHRADAQAERHIGKKFREERRSLEDLLARADSDLGAAYAVFEHRSAVTASVVREFRREEAQRDLIGDMGDLAASFLHMHANRLLRSEQRVQEWILWYFLERLYDAEISRTK